MVGGKRQQILTDLYPIAKTVHKKYKMYKCEGCRMYIRGYEEYIVHKNICEKKHCDICGKTFGCEKTLKKHRKNCPPKRVSCDKCQKTYSRKSDMYNHRKTHTFCPSLHMCTICNVKFMTAKLLSDHMTDIHTSKYSK